ncbi:hypothetical protein ONS95_001930 [Cadophora gregata]|uniref:uncharacterized protein n=1 Tax=Cadophora gregata TaxID=51156 RepID=UPI0026DD42A3|nr:uncharacterized protein ONS95_001930 [Cadophora gregata]KAK0111581.1 hypothetical protein ONS95_001930 [Cadophora gregata]
MPQSSEATSPPSTSLPVNDATTYGTMRPSGAARSNGNCKLKTPADEGISEFSTPLTTPASETSSWLNGSRKLRNGLNSSTKDNIIQTRKTLGEEYAGRDTINLSHCRPLRRPPPAVMRCTAPSLPGPQTNQYLPRIKVPALWPSPHIFGGISQTFPRERKDLSEEEKARVELMKDVEQLVETEKAMDQTRNNSHNTVEAGWIWKHDEMIRTAPSGGTLATLILDVEGSTHVYILDVRACEKLARELNRAIQIEARRAEAEEEREERKATSASEKSVWAPLFGAFGT